MKLLLNETTRGEIIKNSKLQSPARIARSRNYSSRDFKDVDFKKLFTNDEFVWTAAVGKYLVTIAFEGPFEELKWLVKSMKGPNRIKRLNQKLVQGALSKALDTEDLYVRCTCADWIYRFAKQASDENYIYGKPETRPNRYPQTNMDHNQGKACKHILAVLIGKRWVPWAAKAWLQYMQANPELTNFYLWGKKLPSEDNNINDDQNDAKLNNKSDSSTEENNAE